MEPNLDPSKTYETRSPHVFTRTNFRGRFGSHRPGRQQDMPEMYLEICVLPTVSGVV